MLIEEQNTKQKSYNTAPLFLPRAKFDVMNHMWRHTSQNDVKAVCFSVLSKNEIVFEFDPMDKLEECIGGVTLAPIPFSLVMSHFQKFLLRCGGILMGIVQPTVRDCNGGGIHTR